MNVLSNSARRIIDYEPTICCVLFKAQMVHFYGCLIISISMLACQIQPRPSMSQVQATAAKHDPFVWLPDSIKTKIFRAPLFVGITVKEGRKLDLYYLQRPPQTGIVIVKKDISPDSLSLEPLAQYTGLSTRDLIDLAGALKNSGCSQLVVEQLNDPESGSEAVAIDITSAEETLESHIHYRIFDKSLRRVSRLFYSNFVDPKKGGYLNDHTVWYLY